jgi:hypothetical protein
MAMQYYTLEEAARLLNVSPDELKLMSRRGKPRPFKDGGTFQFRVSEIDEMARERGVRSDPELTLREAQPKRRTSEVKRSSSEERTLPPPDVRKKSKLVRSEDPTLPPPTPPKRKSEAKAPKAGEEVFDFDLAAEEADLGRSKPAGGTGKSGTKIGGPSGSDSDVRLVPDGSEVDFEVAHDSDPRNLDKGSAKKKPGTGEKQRDSSVKLVSESPSDSDVKLIGESSSDAVNLDPPKSKTASDSDVRLELPKGAPGKRKKDLQITEEIDLDAEQEDSDQKQGTLRPSSSPVLPTGSPFELASSKPKSDELIPLVPDDAVPTGARHKEPDPSDDFELSIEDSSLEKGKPTHPGSSDELPSLGEGSPISRPDGSSDLELAMEDSSPVGEEGSPPSSETEESSSEFELSLDPETGAAESTEDSSSEFELSLDEAPAESPGDTDSSSEFELSLDDAGGAAEGGGDASSEFELSLDEADEPKTTSDSEFDLTLEPGSSDELEEALAEGKELADVEDSEGSPEAEKDIFETDFDVPTLEEESGSEAVPIDEADTDLDETSDFNVAIDDDLASEEESGSQVVALEDEEEADDAAATVSRPTQAADEEEEVEEDSEVIDEEEAAVETRGGRTVSRKPKKVRWGPIPAIFMIPTVILTIVVGLMCWETLNLMWGNHQGQKISGIITPWLAYDVFGLEKPDGGK